jgi:hypothetical protein
MSRDEKEPSSPFEYAWPGMFGFGRIVGNPRVVKIVSYEFSLDAVSAAWPASCRPPASLIRLICDYASAYDGRVTLELWRNAPPCSDLYLNWYGQQTYGTCWVRGTKFWLHPSAGVTLSEADCGKPMLRWGWDFDVDKKAIHDAVRKRCKRTLQTTLQPYSTDGEVAGVPFRETPFAWVHSDDYRGVPARFMLRDDDTDMNAVFDGNVHRGRQFALHLLQSVFHSGRKPTRRGRPNPKFKLSTSVYMRESCYEEPGQNKDEILGPAASIFFDIACIRRELLFVLELGMKEHGVSFEGT